MESRASKLLEQVLKGPMDRISCSVCRSYSTVLIEMETKEGLFLASSCAWLYKGDGLSLRISNIPNESFEGAWESW